MIEIVVANEEHISLIKDCTNEAFMADTFFKKPEYFLRFSLEDVKRMIAEDNAVFLIALSNEFKNEICGSIYLTWSVSNTNEIQQIIGKFSAASVPPRFEKRGIGKKLVQGVENYLLNVVLKSSEMKDPTKLTIVMEMGVINLRTDLFPWYEKQGYKIISEIRPNDAEVTRIIRDDMDVCCILMRRVLL